MELTPDTRFKITLAGFGAAFVASFGFGWQVQSTLSAINTSLKETVTQLNGVEEKLTRRINDFENLVSDRWTKSQAAEWALRYVVLNPSAKVPDPRNPMVQLGAP